MAPSAQSEQGTATDLAQTLLHQPRPRDDRPEQPWAYPLWAMVLVSLAIAYHTVVLLVHNLPGKGLAQGVHSFFNVHLQAANYMRATGNSQSWAMFAPNPHRHNNFMKVLVKDSHGDVWDMAQDIYGRRPYPYVFYDRMGKINRRLMEEKGYRRHYAAWVCRSWEMTHDGVAADEVQVVKMWSQVPSPSGYAKHNYDPMKLRLDQRDEESIRCASNYHAQVPPEIRQRLGLPEGELFRDVNLRTWWDTQQAQERREELDRQREEAQPKELEEPVAEVEGARE